MSSAGGAQQHAHGDKPWWRVWVSRLIAALSVASIVHITQPIWQPLDDVALVATSYAYSQLWSERDQSDHGNLAHMAIVKIDDDRFQKNYGGRSPLDRNALADDLDEILSLKTVRTVVVDLDLSPTLQEEGDDGQRRLNEVVHMNGHKLVLMEPDITGLTNELKASISAWRAQSAAAGVTFGDPVLYAERGLVRHHFSAHEEATRIKQTPGVEELGRTASRHEKPDTGSLKEKTLREHVAPSAPILVQALAAFHESGKALSPDDACFNEGSYCSNIKVVIFGAGYGSDDIHSTPLGPRHGVDVHAAMVACPHVESSHFGAIVKDVISGLALAWVLHWFWKRYFDTTSGRLFRARRLHGTSDSRHKAWWSKVSDACTPTHPDSAYLYLLLMGVLLTAIVLTVSFLGIVWVSAGNCEAPWQLTGVAVGMTIDAWLVQSVEVASHDVTHTQAELRATDTARTSSFEAEGWNVHLIVKAAVVAILIVAGVGDSLHWFDGLIDWFYEQLS